MADWTDWAGRVAMDAAKGAAAGSVIPGFGTVGGAAIAVATDLVPELAKAIAGDQGGQVAAQVTQKVQSTLQTPDDLQDAGKLSDLRLQLAQIVADREAAADDALVERVKVAAADAANARAMTVQLAQGGSRLAWGAPVISLVVMGLFGTMLVLTVYRAMPTGSERVVDILLGTLGAMATSVVSFWVGSSAGSARKTETLAGLVQRQG